MSNARGFCLSRSRGFTLLEVMVALSIFAVCALVLLQQSGRNARQAYLLETRTLASWIAANELAQLQLASQFPAAGLTETELRFGKRDWTIVRDVNTTSNADLQRAVISVRAAGDSEDNSFQQTGFIGRY